MNDKQEQKLLDIFDVVEMQEPSAISSECSELATIVERYEHKELIGAGGMKKVWRTYDRLTRATIAYAQPRDGLAPIFYDTLLEEAWRTAALSHPNIIKIHDTGIDEGAPYFTMDLKTGDTMKEWKKSRDPSQDLCLEVFLKVCEAMIHAHSRNVLHLDLKPDNIQIEGYNEAIVCDWGAGGDLSGATPGYMPPELRTQNFCADERCDIYGLGAILYFLLTGQSSGEGRSAHEIIADSQTGVRSPRTRFPGLNIPCALDQIVVRAMAVEPELRYQSVDALAADIRRFLKLRPTSNQQNKPHSCAWLFYLRNQFSCNLAVLCSSAIILGGGWSLQKIEEYNKERQAQEIRADQAEQMMYNAKGELTQARQSIDDLVRNHDSEQKSIVNQIDTIAEGLKYGALFRQPLETVKILEELAALSLKYNPDSVLAWHERAEVLFLKLDFAKVREIISRREAHSETVWEVFAALPDESYTLIKNKPIKDILHNWDVVHRKHQQILASRMLAYWRARKELSYDEVVRIYLHWADPAVTDLTFSYDFHTLKLGAEVQHDVVDLITMMFECEKFVLSGNWPKSLYFFKKSGIRELDLSNRSIKDNIKGLRHFSKLQLLTVREGMYSQKELKVLPPRIKVVEVPSD